MSTLVTPTVPESLIIYRRRRGLNQFEAAAHFGIQYDMYREWEKPGSTLGPRQSLSILKANEVCYLKRRRAGMTQKEIAKAVGVSRLWVVRMEAGHAPVRHLREFWKF